MTWTTTLNEIRAAHPCESGWEKLLRGLGKTRADDDNLELSMPRMFDLSCLDEDVRKAAARKTRAKRYSRDYYEAEAAKRRKQYRKEENHD